MIYLATPYSHPNPDVREYRFRCATVTASRMMADGQHVFSPISHSHPIAVAGGLPTGWEFWESYDRAHMQICTKMCVMTLLGWQESVGIKAEEQLACELMLPVEYIDAPYDHDDIWDSICRESHHA